MGDVFEIKKEKPFTLQEAKALLPIVQRITKEAVEQAEQLTTPTQRPSYEQELSIIVDRWSQKILKLGAEPKGLWLVDFDNGNGYYCWHYPEEDVDFFHAYEGGFTGRTPIL